MHFSIIVLISALIFISNYDSLWANPVVDYKQGSKGRAEDVHALIRPKDLGAGEPTSKNRRLAMEIVARGKKSDDAGHIVANALGGLMRPYNLFPQNKGVNRGQFRTQVEDHMRKFLQLSRKTPGNYLVDYQARLNYAKAQDTRPKTIKFKINFFKDGKLYPANQIPVVGKHRVPANPYVGLIQNP